MRRPAIPRVAIIGAGMTGVTCAHALQKIGCLPIVLEKSRGAGGRLATRSTPEGEQFDHGAQYITAREASFQQMLQGAERLQAAAEWLVSDPAQARPPQRWIVGTPGMSSLLKPWASTLEIHTQTTITALRRRADGWYLDSDTGTTRGPFDAVVCTAPAAQCQALFIHCAAMQTALAEVRMAPCWAAMLRYSEALPVAFDARRYEAGAIAWMARQSSRPGYPGKPHSWVLHASPTWSQAHLDVPAEQVLAALQQELAALLGSALPLPSYAAAHRWRYARTTAALGQAFLANDDGTLYAAGDWCLGARVECAYTSGQAVAAALALRYDLSE